jgi:hypothetical protein
MDEVTQLNDVIGILNLFREENTALTAPSSRAGEVLYGNSPSVRSHTILFQDFRVRIGRKPDNSRQSKSHDRPTLGAILPVPGLIRPANPTRIESMYLRFFFDAHRPIPMNDSSDLVLPSLIMTYRYCYPFEGGDSVQHVSVVSETETPQLEED